ncbi:6-carboxytetrahydropterin synthase [soil metagenome]
MFSMTVQDHMMVAHSLPDPFFGPAQALHGATYVVQVRLTATELDEHGVVLDIGAAAGHLASIVADLSYRNLDEHPAFADTLTTTEVLARYVAYRMADALAGATVAATPTATTAAAAQRLTSIEVTLQEHPSAWAGYHLGLADGHQG